MTREAQERGRQAEDRVYNLARTLGEARMATPAEDCGDKTDVVFEGHPIQVSCSKKSNRQRKALEQRGITNIPAGERISDATILSMLRALTGLK